MNNNDDKLKKENTILKNAYEREKIARIETEVCLEKLASQIYDSNQSNKLLLKAIVEISDLKNNVDILLTTYLTAICKMTGIEIAHIFKVDKNKISSLKKWYFKDPNHSSLFEEFKRISETLEFKKNQGLPGRVWECEDSLWIENIELDNNFPRKDFLNNKQLIKSGFAVPIKIKNKVKYVIEFFFTSEVNRIEYITELIESTSTYIGKMIELRKIQEQKKIYVEKLEKANRDLAKAQDKIIQNEKLYALGEMAGGIAHEINNPLMIISGRISLLQKFLSKETILNNEIYTSLQLMDSTVNRIDKIIRSMKSLSRNNDTDPKKMILIGDLFQDILVLCSEKIKEANITLKSDIDKNDYVLCRSIEVSQVLFNLISNSIDALEKQNTKIITVLIKTKTDGTLFKITDTGPGIPDQIMNKVFQPFFTTKEIGKGTGLGLSLSKKIIESHGGILTYKRIKNESIFTFKLPKK